MKLYFSEEDKKEQLNKVETEDIIMIGEYIEILEDKYILSGAAEVEGEKYNEFTIEFQTVDKPSENTIKEIMSMEWDWYDYIVY